MRVIIIEDEHFAYEKLALLLSRADHLIEVVGHATSVSGAVELIGKSPDIDLAFFDIQLSDGISFSIFDRIEVNFPVIFTTAYEDYAIRAFKHNSIDYLLKPIRKADLSNALEKFQKLHKPPHKLSESLKSIRSEQNIEYKNRFMVNIGEHIKMVNTEEISCFYSFDKGTFIQTSENRNYLINFSLEALITKLDPAQFYRVNRKYIINLNFIQDMISYTNSRLKVVLKTKTDDDIIVSREKVKSFRNWLEG